MTDIESNYGLWRILAIIGGIVGIAALFLTWIDVGIEYSGIGLIDLDTSDFQKYIPAAITVLSAIMVVFALVPASRIPCKTGGLIVLVTGIIIVICAAMFALWVGYYSTTWDIIGIGFYLGAVAGALGLVGGLLKTVKS